MDGRGIDLYLRPELSDDLSLDLNHLFDGVVDDE